MSNIIHVGSSPNAPISPVKVSKHISSEYSVSYLRSGVPSVNYTDPPGAPSIKSDSDNITEKWGHLPIASCFTVRFVTTVLASTSIKTGSHNILI